MDLSDKELVATQDVVGEPEKTLTQSQVNEIVKREKAAVADKIRRDMEASQAQALELERQRAEQQPVGMGGMKQENASEMEDRVFNRLLQKAKEIEDQEYQKSLEAQEAEQRATLEKSAQKYLLKMADGKTHFPDFEEVMQDFDVQAFPQLALLAGELDNTPHIMYELAKNPDKVARLDTLVSKSPKMARKELEKLAQSIASNQQAKDGNVETNPPLSRLKSSSVGADSGKMSLKDFKNADWLKG